MSRSFARAALAGTLAFGALVASGSEAQAQGSKLNFTGFVDLFDADETGETLLIDFLQNGSLGGTPTGDVTFGETISGIFDADVAAGDVGTITDMVLSESGLVSPMGSPFLMTGPGGYVFTLVGFEGTGNTFGPISTMAIGNSTIAGFGVRGTVTGGSLGSSTRGFTGTFSASIDDATPAEVYNAINSGQGIRSVNFSAEFTVQDASVVPEPSTYLLMATGLGMIGLIGYRRRSSQQS